jgi:sugar O-acyltransferase (sialic acid O-acetyltransferase NeuD family)
VKVVIVGAGGFGREVADLARAAGLAVIGFVGSTVVGDPPLTLPLLGGDDVLPALRPRGLADAALVAVGEARVREKLLTLCENAGLELPPLVHASASILTAIPMGPGALVYPGVVVMTDCRIGRGVLLNSGATLGHDVVVGDCASVNPGANIAGRVEIGARTVIGIGASVRERITIGADTTVGAGAVVVTDLPAGVVAYGVPAVVRRDQGLSR